MPVELYGDRDVPFSAAHTVATGHLWPLNIWNTAHVAEEVDLIGLRLNLRTTCG